METGMSQSIQGVQSVMDAHSRRAKSLAAGTNNPDMTKDMAELGSDPALLAAQLKAVKTRDDMLGEAIDLKA